MALTPSRMLALGSPMPSFQLPSCNGFGQVNHQDIAGAQGTLVIFLCQHCPYVIHIHRQLTSLGQDYIPQGIGIVGISSNDIESYPQDDAAHLKKMAESLNLNYPICLDEDQSVALAFQAACTPDFFLFNSENKLVYRGQLDKSRPGNNFPLNGEDLRRALDNLIAAKPISQQQYPSMGCNIKWKPGNQPD